MGIRNFRLIARAEGVSFLVLLLVAMPLKYLMGYPLAVKWTGWIHGILFITYLAAVAVSIKPMKWNLWSTLMALAASVIPFGPFFLEKSMRQREQEAPKESL